MLKDLGKDKTKPRTKKELVEFTRIEFSSDVNRDLSLLLNQVKQNQQDPNNQKVVPFPKGYPKEIALRTTGKVWCSRELQEYTPTLSQKLLFENCLSIRKITQPQLRRIIGEMMRGYWRNCSQSFIHDKRRHVLDGTKRLIMSAITGESFYAHVCVNAPIAMKMTVDRIIPRNGADVLDQYNIPHSKDVTGVVTLLLRYTTTNNIDNVGIKPSTEMVIDYLKYDKGIFDSVAFCRAIGLVKVISNIEVAIFCFHLFRHEPKNKSKAETFFEGLALGVPGKSAINQLREILLEVKSSRGYLTVDLHGIKLTGESRNIGLHRSTKVAAINKAWEAWKKGELMEAFDSRMYNTTFPIQGQII